MAIQTITYDNKVDLNTDSSIAAINKVVANDMNEIKSVVNNNANSTPTAIQHVKSSSSNTDVYSTSYINTQTNNTYQIGDTDGWYSCDYINKDNTYSTNEIKTNKLWNGKPIYRKCYDARITTQTSNIDVNNFVSNVDKIVSLTGGTKGNNFSYGFYWKDNSDHYLAILSQNTTNLNIQIGTSYPSVPFNATVIVEYTKTTD